MLGLDPRFTDLLTRTLPTRRPEPFTVELKIPREHPGLPRLAQAALKLHDCTVIRPSGLSLKLSQTLVLPGALTEFFNALRDVVGTVMGDEIEERLSVRHAPITSDGLLELTRAAATLLPLNMLQHLMKG